MDRIMVGLVSLPEMLRDIVSDAVVSASDLEIIDVCVTADDTENEKEGFADVLVVAAKPSDIHSVSTKLLCKYPQCSVLALNTTATEFHTHELQYHHDIHGEPSISTLVNGIRSSAARRFLQYVAPNKC